MRDFEEKIDKKLTDRIHDAWDIIRIRTYNKILLVCWPKHCEFETLIKMDFKSAVEVVYKKINEKSAEESVYLREFEQLIKNLNHELNNFNSVFAKMISILSLILHEEFTTMFFIKILSKKIDKTLFELLAILLNFFDQEVVKRILKKSVTEFYYNNVNLVNGLLEHSDKSIAEFYFNESIVPLLEDKIPYSDNNDRKSALKLLDLILKFTANQEENLRGFVQFVIDLGYSMDASFTDSLIENYPVLCSVKPLLNLLMYRVNSLVDKVASKPIESYEIENAFAPVPELQDFLRSPQREKVFYGPSLKTHKNEMLRDIRNEYGVEYIMIGNGKNVKFELSKSKKKFWSEWENWTRNNEVLKRLAYKLNLIL